MELEKISYKGIIDTLFTSDFAYVNRYKFLRLNICSDAKIEIRLTWSINGQDDCYKQIIAYNTINIWKTEKYEVIMPYLKINIYKSSPHDKCMSAVVHFSSRPINNISLNSDNERLENNRSLPKLQIFNNDDKKRSKSPFHKIKKHPPLQDDRIPNGILSNQLLYTKNGKIQYLASGNPADVLCINDNNEIFWCDLKSIITDVLQNINPDDFSKK